MIRRGWIDEATRFTFSHLGIDRVGDGMDLSEETVCLFEALKKYPEFTVFGHGDIKPSKYCFAPTEGTNHMNQALL